MYLLPSFTCHVQFQVFFFGIVSEGADVVWGIGIRIKSSMIYL